MLSRSPLAQRGLLLSLALTPFALLTGCANMTSTATQAVTSNPQALSGSLHGGRQPVQNALVSLYAAGNSGYGSAGTLLATATTNAQGAFTFQPASGATYTCPAATSTTASQLLYVTASGGQPTTGTTNTQAAFLLALGDCSTALATNPFIILNEISTAASMTALQQFFTPSNAGLGTIGTSATNVNGLKNAMATANNMYNYSLGLSVPSLTVSGAVTGYSPAPTVTITPEQSKIDSFANVLAACINGATGNSNCTTLFADVNSTAALDTVQAAYYMATNPTDTVNGTSNATAVYNLGSAQPIYAPTLAAAPTDWTIGITYGSSSSQPITTAGTTASTFLLTEPEYIGIDSVGNVWVANFGTTSATASGNSVSELSPVGVPINQVLTTAGQIFGPRNLILDPSNNVYVPSFGSSNSATVPLGKQVAEFTSTGTTNLFNLAAGGPEAIASDGAGNVFIANLSGTLGSSSTSSTMPGNDLEVIPAGSMTGTTATVIGSDPTAGGAGTYSSLALDSNDTAWLSNGNTALTQFLCTYQTGVPTACSPTTTTAGGSTAPQTVSIDHGNNVLIGNYSATANGGSLSVIAATSNSNITGVTSAGVVGGGLQSPTRSIIDGLGNLWLTNYKSAAGTLSEFSAAHAPLSPSVGFPHNYSGIYGIAIDASGNVWVGNASAAASTTGTTPVNGFFTEIVGAAGPVMTPLAKNLPVTKGGTSTLGTRP